MPTRPMADLDDEFRNRYDAFIGWMEGVAAGDEFGQLQEVTQGKRGLGRTWSGYGTWESGEAGDGCAEDGEDS